MNGSGLILIAILLVVLFSVSLGAQQMDRIRSEEYKAMMKQRDDAIRLAQEAKSQRDDARGALALAEARQGDLKAGLQKLGGEKNALAQALMETQRAASEQQDQLNRLQAQVKSLESERASLQAANYALRKTITETADSSKLIPVTAPVSSTDPDPKSLCLPIHLERGRYQLSIMVMIIAGMLVLGSGGYVVYHNDPNHKITVRMTRAQIKAYARYQRQQ